MALGRLSAVTCVHKNGRNAVRKRRGWQSGSGQGLCGSEPGATWAAGGADGEERVDGERAAGV